MSGQRSCMQRCAAAQRVQIITPFQGGHDAALGAVLGEVNDEFRHPAKVRILQHQAGQGVGAVGVEAGGNQDQIRPVGLDGGNPVPLQGLAELRAGGAGRQGGVDDVGAANVCVAVGVVWVLEAGAHQHLGAILEDVHGAVAVVDVEVQNGQTVHLAQGAHGAQCDAVVQTEAHGGCGLRMVAGWPHGAEGAPLGAGQDFRNRFHHRARRRGRSV